MSRRATQEIPQIRSMLKKMNGGVESDKLRVAAQCNTGGATPVYASVRDSKSRLLVRSVAAQMKAHHMRTRKALGPLGARVGKAGQSQARLDKAGQGWAVIPQELNK